MKEYHKIQTVFKRDMATKHKTLLIGDYSLPEFEYLKDNTWVFTEKAGDYAQATYELYGPLEKSKGVIFDTLPDLHHAEKSKDGQ